MKEFALIIHFIGLAMGIGTSFGFMFLGIAASKMEPEKALDFQLKSFAMSKMGHIGLALLVLSGLYLIIPYWALLPTSPILIAKLILVVILGALIGIISSNAKKAQQGNAEEYLKKIAGLGKISLLTGLLIIILAVLNFE